MNDNQKPNGKGVIITIIVLIALAVGAYYIWHKTPATVSTNANTKTVTYVCNAGKSLIATYDLSTGGGGVSLALSDGRSMPNVPHALSADGARYANADESFVFWNVGNTAFITEGMGTNATTTFANCIEHDQDNAGSGTVVGATKEYRNDQYGFLLEIPATSTPSTTFKTFYVLSNNWRALAAPGSKGANAVSIPVFSVDNNKGGAEGKPFPLYFDTEVRVGVSSAATDVTSCLQNDAGYTSEPEKDVMLSGVPFKAYTFSDQAMMQYIKGVSYRAVHNGSCYVVEQLATGSVYTDPTMTAGLSQATLDAYFTEAGTIAQTFQFTK
jgi:membrane-bound inhibitor of C-type lysozyme